MAYSSFSMSKVLNNAGQWGVNVPGLAPSGSTCCEVFKETEPYRDEVIFYRDKDIATVGPVKTVKDGSIDGLDLFHWMELRFLEEDLFRDGDAADVFRAVFDQAYEKDESPNISISTRHSGVSTIQSFKGKEFRRAADVLRGLARFGVDFTMDGRRLLAGGLEVFLDTEPLLLHDDGVISAEPVKEGENFATDVAVFAAAAKVGDDPITGRETRNSLTYGLIQKSFTELNIKDRIAADANALARLESMQPAPVRVTAVLSEKASFNFVDLIPGRRVDVRLKDVMCIPVVGVMRLLSVKVDVSRSDSGISETVTIDLVPLGLSEGDG